MCRYIIYTKESQLAKGVDIHIFLLSIYPSRGDSKSSLIMNAYTGHK